MKEISRQFAHSALSASDPPAAHITPGETVRFETFDCYHVSLLPEGNTFADVDRSVGNPATGPVYIDGAMPGDMLKIHVDRIEFGPVGILDIGPTSGALAGIFEEPVINRLRVQDGMIDYKGIQVPVRPMIGVIGVAPAGEPVSTMTLMDHRRVRRHAGRGVRQGFAADVPLPDGKAGSGIGRRRHAA